MVSRLKRPSKLKRRSAAAKALGDRLFRQRVVAAKKRKGVAKDVDRLVQQELDANDAQG